MIKLKHIYKMVETHVIYIKVTKNSLIVKKQISKKVFDTRHIEPFFPGCLRKWKLKKAENSH